ncbi:hypothetical protein B484DRAFT_400366 [Ochromonadaceae sp. CCMP2298]|nr:hypothetical protein B484DRAFT_400366 [Ochromonadaceae sp. CCMP2298]|mmetsp:Transcript_24047/g.53469  ORF Transcript_24047/g.53469 Transcript_24047/m.53469 type:complete len:202 (+) Transcript_24047:150-755(+)
MSVECKRNFGPKPTQLNNLLQLSYSLQQMSVRETQSQSPKKYQKGKYANDNTRNRSMTYTNTMPCKSKSKKGGKLCAPSIREENRPHAHSPASCYTFSLSVRDAEITRVQVMQARAARQSVALDPALAMHLNRLVFAADRALEEQQQRQQWRQWQQQYIEQQYIDGQYVHNQYVQQQQPQYVQQQYVQQQYEQQQFQSQAK